MSSTLAPSPATVSESAVLRPLLRRNAAVIQGTFATLWAVRFALVTGAWLESAAVALVAVGASVLAFRDTRGLQARTAFRTAAGRRFLRPVTIATVVQILASILLPMAVGMLGGEGLVMPTVALTISTFLIWFARPLALPAVAWVGGAWTVVAISLPLGASGATMVAATCAVASAALLVSTWCTARAATH